MCFLRPVNILAYNLLAREVLLVYYIGSICVRVMIRRDKFIILLFMKGGFYFLIKLFKGFLFIYLEKITKYFNLFEDDEKKTCSKS